MQLQNLLNHLKLARNENCAPEPIENGGDQIRIIR